MSVGGPDTHTGRSGIKNYVSQYPPISHQNSGKIDFMAKIAKKQVFRPNFRANFRFCTKFGPIRQSHGQPEMSAKFQPNPTLFEEFVIFYQKHF